MITQTPYYMTVVGLNIDGKTNSESFLIKPFDKYLINSSINNPSSVSWYFVNDYGVNTEKQTIKLELDDSQSDKKTML
ncbi:Gram-negative pili assembly chaperone, C-terminal domain [Providencia stuartii]|nr:Gram-negative pili assembly chaperone, C-terminal domain [Providencia stuartii]